MTRAGLEAATGAILKLPQSVADAIAAGEVVERPASVVKELCENSVDAGAASIDVVIDGGGMVRVRVVDDGSGIVAQDLHLALARHATSKIRAAADLEAIATLGFRGEALASIAAVADVRLCSRPRAATAGALVRARHGEIVEDGAWGGPAGTTIEVLDLFAATPARLRFLRGERAETAAALAVVSDLALIRPDLRLTCTVDGRNRLRSPGGTLDSALRSVFGAEADELLPVTDEGDINVGGAVSEPRRHRATRAGLVMVVNGRRVHNRALLAAAAEAYRGLIPPGRYPFGVISVEVDPVDVDVNVHPTKREVRLRDERRVYAAVQGACWRALQGASVYHAHAQAGGASRVGEEAALWSAATPPQAPDDRPTSDVGTGFPADGSADVTLPWSGSTRTTLAALRPLRALGQQQGRWLLATSSAGVVVVDPHAAHEKVIYSELLTQWAEGSTAGQLLLIPALLECDARRMELFTMHTALVAACGFSVEPFGPATLRCSAVPTGAASADPARLLADLLDSLGAGGPVTEQRHRVAALIACHAAVRFGDELSAGEQQGLLDRLVTTAGGLTCPHGRPAIAVFDDAALRRIFRRPAE